MFCVRPNQRINATKVRTQTIQTNADQNQTTGLKATLDKMEALNFLIHKTHSARSVGPEHQTALEQFVLQNHHGGPEKLALK